MRLDCCAKSVKIINAVGHEFLEVKFNVAYTYDSLLVLVSLYVWFPLAIMDSILELCSY